MIPGKSSTYRYRKASCFRASKVILLGLLFFFSIPVHLLAQFDQSLFFQEKTMIAGDSNQLILSFRSCSFLRNNEYVNPIYKGYTLFGFNAEPVLSWQSGANTRVTAGLFTYRYDGKDQFGVVRPVFTVQQRLTENIDLFFGSINGAAGHQLSHPVYSLERNLNQVPEEGIQFLFHGNHLRADLWVNWEKFLLWGENKQEELSGGLSVDWKLTAPENLFTAQIPFYLMACHRGGQIDVSPNPIQTLLNMGITPGISGKTDLGFVSEVGLNMAIHQFVDGSPQKLLPTHKGYAVYPSLLVKSYNWSLETGYWQGTSFFAKKGDPLFQSIAFTDGSFLKKRDMLCTQLTLKKNAGTKVNFGLQAEAYYDLNFKELDYSYSFYLIFTDQWLLWKKNRINR
jgi:hypothetical protein